LGRRDSLETDIEKEMLIDGELRPEEVELRTDANILLGLDDVGENALVIDEGIS
jgi:hypothetical protein